MFQRDSRTETFLNLMGAKWVYSNNILLSALDPRYEISNLGRSQAVVKSAVDSYALMEERGSSGPAPILRQLISLYEVLDGVQRIKGTLKNKYTKMNAYVVTTDSESLATQIRVQSNPYLAGSAENTEWSKKQSVQHLCIELGMSLQEAAGPLGWPVSELKKIQEYLEMSAHIVQIGGPAKLPAAMVAHIVEHAKLIDLEKAQVPVAAFLTDVHKAFNAHDSEPYIKDFFNRISRGKTSKLHDQFTTRLKTFRTDPEVRVRLKGRKKVKQTPETIIGKALRSARTVTQEAIDAKNVIYNVTQFYQIHNTIGNNLKRIEDFSNRGSRRKRK